MTEPHPGAELDQTRRLGRRGRVGADPEPLGRAPQQGHVADRLRRRRQQESLRLDRERLGPAGGSSARCGSPAAARRDGRTRPPAPPRSTPGAAPATRAGCRASRRRSGRAPARPVARGSPSPAARGHRVAQAPDHHHRKAPQLLLLARAPARRTPRPPIPPGGGAPRSQGPAPKPDRATARHRPRRRAAAPRRPRTAGSARPDRPESDPPPHRR